VVRSAALPSAIPRNTLSVRLNKPGLDFAANRAALQACIQTSRSQGGRPANVPIEKIEGIDGSTTDAVNLVLALPAGLRPFLYDHGHVAVILSDGRFLGEDQFRLIGVVAAFAAALAAVFVGHLLVRLLILGASGSWLSWFSAEAGRPSLSLFQIYLWTWVVFEGCVYVAVLTGEPLAITWQVLALVGIAGAGSISSRFVTVSQERTPVTGNGGFSEIFQTDGNFDLYKLQMFLFTVFTALFVVGRVVVDRAFPELDTNLLLLLGISNGIYVGSKVAGGENPFRAAERLDVELKVLEEAKSRADADVSRLETEIGNIDARLQEARAAGQPTTKLDADRKLLEKQKQEAADKAEALQTQIAATTDARTKAIDKL
jgi:hypothetical protein